MLNTDGLSPAKLIGKKFSLSEELVKAMCLRWLLDCPVKGSKKYEIYMDDYTGYFETNEKGIPVFTIKGPKKSAC